MNMRYYEKFASPQGDMLLLASDQGLEGVFFKRQKHHPEMQADWRQDPQHKVLRQARRELEEYFAGRRKRFQVALDPGGTEFQRAVWRAISSVGFGETITYAELAERAGHEGSARAAGAATGRNPIGIIVPCHRIVGSDGDLTGYAGGLERKRALLELEAGEAEPT
jgi:methylated-DNA-[protein]-cysteine S-methyltransferase